MNLLDHILFIDIETVSQHGDFNNLSERKQNLWNKKSQQWRKEMTPKEAYKKAAIYAEFGRIICISAGFIHQKILYVKSFYGDEEQQLLLEFKESLEKLEKNKKMQLCAHNGKEFDFPYICRRMLINEIALPKTLQIQGKKPWEISLLDTLELWRFGDYKNYTSLDLLCEIFNIPTPKSDISGNQVGEVYWEEHDLKRIVHYCESDVIALVQLYLKIKGLPSLEDKAIQFVQ